MSNFTFPLNPTEGLVFTAAPGKNLIWMNGRWRQNRPLFTPSEPVKTINGQVLVGSGDITVVTPEAPATLQNKTLEQPVMVAPRERKEAMTGNVINLANASMFTKTISGNTTFSLVNTPANEVLVTFMMELINAGSATLNFWPGVKWAGGTQPSLTAAGKDVLGFYSYDGGVTWVGLVIGKDVK